MGLLRDAISSALGGGQINNGFNGPRATFTGGQRGSGLSSRGHQYSSAQPQYDYGYVDGPSAPRENEYNVAPVSNVVGQSYGHRRHNSGDPYPQKVASPTSPENLQTGQNSYAAGHDSSYPPPPPPYEGTSTYGDGRYIEETADSVRLDWNNQRPNSNARATSYNEFSGRPGAAGIGQGARFRPFALPQIDFGDGQPFLRGYSSELARYGVSEREFIEVLDKINVAITPNPENQLFQKGANIAGWFLPGAAGIGLMAGQVGVGLSSAFGHASVVARVLSKANLEVFVPKGLEICICQSTDVDNEVGFVAGPQRDGFHGTTAEARIASYGYSVAPLTRALPALQNAGRNDPIAVLGRGVADRDQQKKTRKAQKKMAKGRSEKYDQMQGSLKWLMVRRASDQAMQHWQRTWQQSNEQSQ